MKDGWHWARLKAHPDSRARIIKIERGDAYECGCDVDRQAAEYVLLGGPLDEPQETCD